MNIIALVVAALAIYILLAKKNVPVGLAVFIAAWVLQGILSDWAQIVLHVGSTK